VIGNAGGAADGDDECPTVHLPHGESLFRTGRRGCARHDGAEARAGLGHGVVDKGGASACGENDLCGFGRAGKGLGEKSAGI
jgi:hypothetical protein